jgi:hypothetical protein
MPLYTFLRNLPIALVQIANNMDCKKAHDHYTVFQFECLLSNSTRVDMPSSRNLRLKADNIDEERLAKPSQSLTTEQIFH